ncbi:MAG: tetratricopeptide repeat protein [Chthoniobacterales bacterium]
MKKLIFLFTFSVFAISAFGGLYEEAMDALNEEVYSVAVYKLENFLGQKPTPAQIKKAKVALAQALLSSGEAGRAISYLQDPALADDPSSQLLLAQALSKTGNLKGALRIFDALRNGASGQEKEQAYLGSAAMRKALNKPDEALTDLEFNFTTPLIHNRAALLAAEIHLSRGDFPAVKKDLTLLENPRDNEKLASELLAARLAFKEGDMNRCAELYDGVIQKAKHIDPRLAVIAVNELADAYSNTAHLQSAEDALEKFIQENAANPGLADVFFKLDEIYFRQGDNASSELKKWALEKGSARSALAEYFSGLLSLRDQRADRAQDNFATFIKENPNHEFLPDAYLQLGRILMGQGHYLRAIDNFRSGQKVVKQPRVAAQLWFAIADAQMGHQDYAEAEKAYLKASENPDFSTAAGYNAELARIRGNLPGSLDSQQDIASSDGLRLMRALELARQRNPNAKTELQAIADSKNGLVSESAAVALAELSFVNNDEQEAKKQIQAIRNDGGSDVSNEQTDYLSIFLSNGKTEAENAKTVREKAEQFLSHFPHSEFAPLVRMKLAEACFRQGDYATARLNFLEVARANTDANLSEQALFLAAQSEARSLDADSLNQAMEDFEDIATGNGTLASRARLEQARVKNAMQQPEEAIVIIDRLVQSNPASDVRFEAIIEKGQTLFRLGLKDPTNYQKAADAFFLVGRNPEASPTWRNQALTKAAQALEKTGDKQGALAAFYDVLNAPRTEQPEYFWYYKAGFDAGELLEADHSWKEAIAIYEKMAKPEGPRSQEAKARVNKLRLKNLIWEEDQQ